MTSSWWSYLMLLVFCAEIAHGLITEAQMLASQKLIRRSCKTRFQITNDDELNDILEGKWDNISPPVKVTRDGHMDYEITMKQAANLLPERRAETEKTINNCKDAEMGKIKQENADTTEDTSMKQEELSYEDKLSYVSVIAKPMASKKLTKKCYKLIKKAIKHKSYVRNGLKDVQSRIRKGETGIVLFAGDVTPIEIMCHLPGVCEDKCIPYCYTPSRVDLGAALGVKRGSLMVLIRENEDYKDAFNECKEEINSLALTL